MAQGQFITRDHGRSVVLAVASAMLAWPADAQQIDDLRGPFGAVAAAPVAPAGPVERGPGTPEDDPFAPPGLRLGTFDVGITLDLGVTGLRGRDTIANTSPPPAFVDDVTTGAIGEAALNLRATSDWSRHALDLGLSGQLPVRIDGDDDQTPSLDLDSALRLDLGLDTTLTATAGYSYSRDDPASAAVEAATDPILFPGITADNEADVHNLDAALALARQIGPILGEVEINAERQLHAAARLSDGSIVSQDDLDFTRVGGRLRGGLDTGAVVTPFLEAEVSQRIMDERPDAAGLDRNALRYAARVGVAIDRGEKLNGEIALGYVYEDLADPALADIGGVSVQGALNWSPVRGTDVALGLATTTQTSASDEVDGSVLYEATMGVDHQARANLDVEADLALRYTDARSGAADELTASASVGATWWLNRLVGLTGRIGHERTFSADPAAREETSSGFVGIRLQR